MRCVWCVLDYLIEGKKKERLGVMDKGFVVFFRVCIVMT